MDGLHVHLQLENTEMNPAWRLVPAQRRAAAKERANALITIRNSLLNRSPKQIADLAIKNRLPSITEGSDYVQAGGLMSYSANDAENYRRAATYVDKMLKGANLLIYPWNSRRNSSSSSISKPLSRSD